MFVVGGTSRKRSPRNLNIWTGAITNEANMMEKRRWPGMLVYKGCVWIFGGAGLASVERFHCSIWNWERGPQMLTPKFSFTPCEHQALSTCPSPDRKQLEALDPVTEVYSLRPLELYGFFMVQCPSPWITFYTLWIILRMQARGHWIVRTHT